MFTPASAANFLERIKIETRDPDLGRTLVLWLAEDLIHFSQHQPQLIKIVDGGKTLSVSLKKDIALIKAPENFHLISLSSASKFVHKMKNRLGLAVSPFALTQEILLNHYRQARNALRIGLKLSQPPQSCRFLLRVDDFPSLFRSSKTFQMFHETARGLGLPYLLAVTPYLDRGEGPVPLSEAEIKTLQQCAREGVTLALHGFTHKSRIQNYNSELVSMPAAELEENILKAKAYFQSHGLKIPGFVAPFNTYEKDTAGILARHFSFLCGGPESTLSLGTRLGPSFFQNSLYIPSYEGVYDLKAADMPSFDQLIQRAQGFILPVTLHWANEIGDHLKSFRVLSTRLKASLMPWENLMSFSDALKSIEDKRG